MAANEEASKLFRIRKTVNEMLQDRGYNISQAELKMNLDTFLNDFGNPPSRTQITMLASKRDDDSDQIFVFFADEVKLGVKPIRTFFEKMEEIKVKRAIVVVQGGITPYAQQVVKAMVPHGNVLEQFQEAELLVNITHHVLVPKHILLTDEEKKALLEKYKLKSTQLPRIQQSDPVARYYGLQKGQVVKIIRPSETAGRYVTYRLVI